MREGNYHLSPAQAQAILDLRLHRLTGLEHEKLLAEFEDKLIEIAGYLEILGDPDELLAVIRTELEEIEANFGDERRSEIVASRQDLTAEDLIPEEDRVVTISHGGYAKTQPLDAYQAQKRGGVGRAAASVKDEDFVEQLFVAGTHDTILCFSNMGKVYWLKVYQIPVGGRGARGRPMVNLLPLETDERITSVLTVDEYREDQFILMSTANGTVKKTSLSRFARPRSVGLRAIELDEGDHLVGTAITDGHCDVMLVSSSGKVIRFHESDVRAMGRVARGVRGMRLVGEHRVISLIVPRSGNEILTVSCNGYGKRTAVEDFPVYGRAGQGVIGMRCSERNGNLVSAIQLEDCDQMMLISDHGTLVRTRVDEVPVLGRNTQGVRVIRLRGDEKLVSVDRIAETEDDSGSDEQHQDS